MSMDYDNEDLHLICKILKKLELKGSTKIQKDFLVK